MICLPPHSSHILQPLDRVVCCHLKRVWKKTEVYIAMLNECQKTLRRCSNRCIRMENVLHVFTLFYHLFIAGFEYNWLFLLNKKRINQHPLAISKTFNQPTPLMPLPTVQPSPLSSEPAAADSRFDRYKALQERMKNEMENEVMSFFREKNHFHVKKI